MAVLVHAEWYRLCGFLARRLCIGSAHGLRIVCCVVQSCMLKGTACIAASPFPAVCPIAGAMARALCLRDVAVSDCLSIPRLLCGAFSHMRGPASGRTDASLGERVCPAFVCARLSTCEAAWEDLFGLRYTDQRQAFWGRGADLVPRPVFARLLVGRFQRTPEACPLSSEGPGERDRPSQRGMTEGCHPRPRYWSCVSGIDLAAQDLNLLAVRCGPGSDLIRRDVIFAARMCLEGRAGPMAEESPAARVRTDPGRHR